MAIENFYAASNLIGYGQAISSVIITGAIVYGVYVLFKPLKHWWRSHTEQLTKMNLLWLAALDKVADKRDLNLEQLFKEYTKESDDLRKQNWHKEFEKKIRDEVHEEFFGDNPYKE